MQKETTCYPHELVGVWLDRHEESIKMIIAIILLIEIAVIISEIRLVM